MKQIILILLIIPMVVWAKTDISKMSISEKCDGWRPMVEQIVDSVYNNVPKEEQIAHFRSVLAGQDYKEELRVLEGFVDVIYKNTPYIDSIALRKEYKKSLSDGAYQICINQYVNQKP